jgi:hypothetical protein
VNVLVEDVTINAILSQDVKQLVEYILAELAIFVENMRNTITKDVFQSVEIMKNIIQDSILAIVKLDIQETQDLINVDGTVDLMKSGMENVFAKTVVLDMEDHALYAHPIQEEKEINVFATETITGILENIHANTLAALPTQPQP